MDVPSDAGSVIEVQSNPSPATSWTNKELINGRRSRTARRKRKPMTSPQPSHISRRCNNCGVTKTPQWREGPDGPKTLCNACGVKYSRERQDKSKSRKSRKLKAKTGIKSKLSYSVKKRTRNSDRDRLNYDFAFLSFSTPNPSPTLAKRTGDSISGFTGKEYAAALSLVSLAILGDSAAESSSRMHIDESELTQPKTRRSKRIARRTCTRYYGGLDSEEWIPHLIEEMEECRIWNSKDDVATGVPCVWAAMGYAAHPCCACKQQASVKKATDTASSASDSAKTDFLYTHTKL